MKENTIVLSDFLVQRSSILKRNHEAKLAAKEARMVSAIKIGNSIELRIANTELREALRAKFEKR